MLGKREMCAGLAALLLLGGSPARGQAGDAKSRLEEEVRARALDKKAAAQRSRFLFDMGKRLYSEMQYVRARECLQRAVTLDPTNRDAAALLEKVNDVLEVRMPSIRTSLEMLAREKRVVIQENLVGLENALRRAQEALLKAKRRRPEGELDVQRLAEEIRSADAAIMFGEQAREIIKWMPSEVDTKEQKGRAETIVAEARAVRARRRAELRQEKSKQSLDRLQEQQLEERKLEEAKIARLLDQVQMLFDNEEFGRSETLAERVMELDPANSRARELWGLSREQQYLKRDLELRRSRKEEKLKLDERLAEAGIPYSELLVYPPDWREITTRESVEAAEAAEPQWKKDVRRKLDRKVTFEFVDTPLSEAIQFLQTLTETTIILDAKAFEGGVGANTPITLKVTKMPLRTALKWILRLADLDYTLKNEAVFISTPKNLAGEVELKIFDIRDLTYTITSFPGPELILTTASGGGGMGAAGAAGPISIDAPPPESLVAAGSLAELIMSRVQPSSWGADLGTSIEERSGKLVVMQKPEILRLIAQLLKTFRESQTLQVSVQARFIEVRDGFLEDIGVEFADLPDASPHAIPLSGPAPANYAPTDWYWGPNSPLSGTINPNHPFVATGVTDSVGVLHADTQTDPASEFDYWARSTAFTNRVYPFGSRLPQLTPAGSGQGMTFQFRFIGNVLVQGILHALKKEEKGDLLLAPKLTMYNNQRAYIMAAMQRAYISDYDISGSVYDPIISTIMTGTVLDVRPTVSHDRRYITMNFQPGTADNLEFEIRTLVGGALNLPIYLPSIRFRSVRTTIMVPDGGTVLVSGLMTETKFDAASGIPFLSDLPVVGRLFGTDLKQRDKQNLLIMCSANLILFEEEEAKQL